jgi:hydrogenase maturation protease
MRDLRQQLTTILRDRLAIVAIGNPELGDDAVGMKIAALLHTARGRRAGPETASSAHLRRACRRATAAVFSAGLELERHLAALVRGRYDSVLFLDAVDFAAPAGSVALFNAEEIASRFPQVSTHRLSLGLISQLLGETGATRVWLLGIKPASLQPGAPLSPPVRIAAHAVAELILDVLAPCSWARSSDSPEPANLPWAITRHENPVPAFGPEALEETFVEGADRA